MHKPPAVHLCVALRHTQPGVADVQSAVTSVIEHELALLPDFTEQLARGESPVW